MFDLFQFVADCRDAMVADKSHKYVREVVARAVSDPAAVLAALGEPQRAGLHKLYQSGDLTVLNVVWAPMMTVMPHNHQMWAVIGIYTGREDNIFWRRVPGTPGKVEAAGAKALSVGEAEPLGHNIIHSVTNPIPRLTGAIHVYGGRFLQSRPPQRVGFGNADGAAVRSRARRAPVRRRQQALHDLRASANLGYRESPGPDPCISLDAQASNVRCGSCVTSIASPNGGAQLYER